MFRKALSLLLKSTGLSPQMLVGYALLISLSAVASVCAVLWWKNAKLEEDLEKQNVRLAVTELVVNEQSKQIQELQDLRSIDQKALDSLYGDLSILNSNDATLKYKLFKLESKDETIKSFLDMDVPAGISCMYDETCSSASNDKNKTVGASGSTNEGTAKVSKSKASKN